MTRRHSKRLAHAMTASILENFIDKVAECFEDTPRFEGLAQEDSDAVARILFGITDFHRWKASGGHRQPKTIAKGMR